LSFLGLKALDGGLVIRLERQRKIAEMVGSGLSVEVPALARQFTVSEETIRRDLRILSGEGRLLRSHGGALPLRDTPLNGNWFFGRSRISEENIAIAREACMRVAAGDSILLDGSGLCQLMARHLPDIRLTVLTNSLRVVEEIAGRERVKVILTGGLLRPDTLWLEGPLAERAMDNYHVEKLFFSCDGLDLRSGASEADDTGALIKRRMVDGAAKHILLLERGKLGTRSLSVFCQINEIHEIITDAAASRVSLEILRKAGVTVSAVGKETKA
jgi:DeoR family transcriptional regulator, fructose operon transcriptional repressor